MHKAEDFSKIKSLRYARRRSLNWCCVLDKNDTERSRRKLRNIVKMLKKFEGYLIKADGIIGKLVEVNMPPKGSLITFEGGQLHCCPIDKYFSIYLAEKVKK